ncbi:uncharacterized protein L3040_004051 [Drepanopeziza brunnea f. sp. 'multigermtubi']|uniref:uncharacterized protein n=1 Tax=Drepanopeziza brunnea f. sp. 'multigermtubi' TaxID=698441 RepID=UPI00239B461C|nr:hypothetical protein L3040_004051 [Drepanopeziza brunnea f. sp. 'multigermtubi']
MTALLHFYHSSLAHRDCGGSFKLDVHSPLVPDIYRAALIDAGYPVKDGVVYTDGFPVSARDLETHIRGNEPPQPDIPRGGERLMLTPASQDCLDSLHFDGVGLYTNFAGTYLGDPVLNSILQALHDRQATVFVHPSEPGCATADMAYPSPLTDAKTTTYPATNIMFLHGGGALPYRPAALPVNGNLDPETSMRQFRGFYFHPAGASLAIQLRSMNQLGGVGKIVTGTDYPYVPVAAGAASLAAVQANGNYSIAERARIHGLHAHGISSAVARELGWSL